MANCCGSIRGIKHLWACCYWKIISFSLVTGTLLDFRQHHTMLHGLFSDNSTPHYSLLNEANYIEPKSSGSSPITANHPLVIPWARPLTQSTPGTPYHGGLCDPNFLTSLAMWKKKKISLCCNVYITNKGFF